MGRKLNTSDQIATDLEIILAGERNSKSNFENKIMSFCLLIRFSAELRYFVQK